VNGALFPEPFRDLIRINYPPAWLRKDTSIVLGREVTMPFDAMLVSAAVVAMFVAFAVVLLWGDYQTRPDRLRATASKEKPEVEGSRRRAA
jgi:K+-transporting ATPase A subunit